MKIEYLYICIFYLVKSVLFAGIYISLWLVVHKKINNEIIRAILLGPISPFFFYNFMINVIYPISCLLYSIDTHGILFLIIGLTAKPLSIILGIIITLILLVEDDFMNELKK